MKLKGNDLMWFLYKHMSQPKNRQNKIKLRGQIMNTITSKIKVKDIYVIYEYELNLYDMIIVFSKKTSIV